MADGIRDERTFPCAGAIRGSVHVPLDQLPAALTLPADQFSASYSFPKPGPDDLVIMTCAPGCPCCCLHRRSRRPPFYQAPAPS